MTESKLDPFSIPPQFLYAIGVVTTLHSVAEMMLETLIHGLAGLEDERGDAVTAHMTTPLRLSVLRSLAALALKDKPAVLREANEVALDFQRVAGLRADIVHAVWFFDPSDAAVLKGTITARKILRKSLDEQSIDKIEFVIDEIRGLIARLVRLTLLTRGWFGDLPAGHTETEVAAHIESNLAELLAEQAEADGRQRGNPAELK